MKKVSSFLLFPMIIFGLTLGQTAFAYIPNDPLLPEQSYLQKINAYSAWDYVRNSNSDRQVVVAILDTGVDLSHPDLLNSLWVNSKEIPDNGIDDDNNSYIDDIHGWNFIDANNDPEPTITAAANGDAVSHGTVVAGLIAAGFDNAVGIAGLAPGVKIMAIKALDSQGSGNTLVLSQAIDYAVDNGANVINLSLVGKVLDPRLTDSIARAYIHGVAVVAAAGNEEVYGVDLNNSPRYPVCDANGANQVLGVASLNDDNVLSRFSNYGSQCVDLSAPGTGIFSTAPIIDGNPQFSQWYSGGWTGTSVAAPMASALIANMMRVAPKLTLDQIYNIIIANTSSIQLANPTDPKAVGSGLLNMAAALAVADRLQKQQSQLLAIAPLAGRPQISLLNRQGNVESSFLAYAVNFTGGVNVAVGDVDGDGQSEIITAPYSNGGPQIRIFDGKGKVKSQFMAYDAKMKSGYSLAVGDVDGDGVDEIITVPNSGQSSLVRVFDYKGNKKAEFYAYDQQFHGGSLVAIGDFDRNGRAEIITMPKQQGGPQVRVFDYQGAIKTQFMAFNANTRSSYALAVGDLDHDLYPDIITADLNSGKTEVRIFDSNGSQKNIWLAFPQLQQKTYRLNFLADDYTGDNQADLLVYPADRGVTSVDTYDFNGRVLSHLQTKLINSRGWSVAVFAR